MKFVIKDLSGKCDHIRRELRIWSHLLKKSLMDNLFFVEWKPTYFGGELWYPGMSMLLSCVVLKSRSCILLMYCMIIFFSRRKMAGLFFKQLFLFKVTQIGFVLFAFVIGDNG